MNISSRTKGVLMAVIGSIFWGGSGVAAQFILQEKGMTADYLTAVRTIVAGILLIAGALSVSIIKDRKSE